MHARKRRGVRDRPSGRGRKHCSIYNRIGHTDGKSNGSGDEACDQFRVVQRMGDIIDIDTGGIISGETSIEQMGEEVLRTGNPDASGEMQTKAE